MARSHPRVRRNELFGNGIATIAAFGTYFAMYAFRKPFTAAAFAEPGWFANDRKTELVIAQVIGYTVSKFVGIAIVAAMPRERRALWLLGLIAIAELALAGFAVAPAPWDMVCLFLNGLPLGMVFGLVLSFLEGRRHTEAMAAGLCASFIVADGAMKSIGSWLLAMGVSERWMPCTAGLLFALPLAIGVAALKRVPPPSEADVESRSERVPMTRQDRRQFFARYAPGLVLLVIAYLAITILRSLRADFSPELWRQLGHPAAPSDFTSSELLVAVGVLIATGCTVLIRDNRRAFAVAIGLGISGLLLCLFAISARSAGNLDGFAFQVTIGLGLYLPYVAVHTTIFERLVAITRDRSNVGFLMYLADSFGYLGYVAVMMSRGSLRGRDDLLVFFTSTTWVTAIVGSGCFAFAGWWLLRKTNRLAGQKGEDPATQPSTS